MGIEPATSSLPRKCSTTELQRLIIVHPSLPSPATFPHQCGMLYHWATTAYLTFHPFKPFLRLVSFNQNQIGWSYNLNERETRFEPATYSLEGYRSTNWATPALIAEWWFLIYEWIQGHFLQSEFINHHSEIKNRPGGETRIRTLELVRGQIYSLLSLATWLSPQKR